MNGNAPKGEWPMPSLLFSLRTRAFLLVGIGFGIFLVAMAYQAVRERREHLEIAKDQVFSTAKLIAVEENDVIESTAVLLDSLIASRDLSRFVDAAECQRIFARTVKQLPQFGNILLALPDGKVICSATPLSQPLNIADRPYFQTALKSSGTVIGEAFEGRVTGRRVLPIYRALRDETGHVQGIVNAGLELAWLNDALANSKYREGARVGLIDFQGHVLARHPDPEGWVGRSASETSFFEAVKAHGGEGVIEDVGFDGVPRVYGLAHFSSTAGGPITLWVGYATDSVTAEAEREFVGAIVGVLVLLFVTFAAIWAGGERLLLRPISILSGTARRLGTGDLAARTGIGSARDELGVLARSIDEMAESLEAKSNHIILADRALNVLSAWNRALKRPSDEQALAEGMCKAIVDSGGYRMAWVGFAEDNADKTVRPVASAGTPEGFFEDFPITWAHTASGQGPAGEAIRQGAPVVVNDVQMNLDAEPLREHLGRFGYASIIAFPLKADDGILGVLVIGAAEINAFAEQEAVLLAEVATHLSSAIFAQRSRAERARLEVSLQSSEGRFRAAAEASPDALFVFKSVRDGAGNIVDLEITAMNARAAQQIGMAPDDAIGKTYFGLLPLYKTVSSFDKYAQVATTGARFEGEFSFDVPQKGKRWFRQQVVRVGDGIAISLRDVTGWKTAGDKIRQSEERLRRAMEAAHMGAWQWDIASDQFSSSEGNGRLFGMAPESGPRNSKELLNIVHPADREALARAMAQDRTIGTPGQLEYRVVWPDGSVHWLAAHTNVIRDASGKPAQAVGVAMDITERKQAEIALERANRALRTLSAGNEELVRATSESGLLHAVCRVIVEKGGYRVASVGYPKDDSDKTITPMAWAGAEQPYITDVMHTWADTEEGQRPIARAIRTKMPAIARNIQDDLAFAAVKGSMAAPGYVSNLALPLLDGTQIVGALSIRAEEKEAFDEAEIQLLEELAGNLAYGIGTLRTRAERDHIAHEHQHHEEILRRSLEESIQAIAATVEMRDPYTSGHQKRVADLAVAIATEMDLDEDKIHGIHLAGVVHDLGKIAVPSEILAKPGKLTAIEFQLIKVHPQAGYDILKDINFPWPIANIVWEHHERVDGSGYPRGIKGGEILLESRIMAVADVVEAMASHRPYRASLGIERALQEIERGHGTAYDADVVDACLKLFRERRFAFHT